MITEDSDAQDVLSLIAVMADRPMRTLQLPYSATEWATLQAAFPLSEAEWDRMLAILNAMKPALVAQDQSGANEGSADLANTSDAYIGHIFGRIGSQQKVSNEPLYG